MKQYSIGVILALVAVVVVMGCSTTSNTTLLPEQNNTYKVISFASTESAANKSAVSRATDVCNQSGKSMVVLNHASKYQGGLTKGDKQLIKTGSEIASLIDGQNLSVDPSSSDDYKVVIEFQCQ